MAAIWLVAFCGCVSTKQIRVHNVSARDFSSVRIADQFYGNIAPGEQSDYKSVDLRLRYATLELHVDGRYFTGQTLNFGAERFTYRIDVADFEARHLAIEIEKDSSPTAGRGGPRP